MLLDYWEHTTSQGLITIYMMQSLCIDPETTAFSFLHGRANVIGASLDEMYRDPRIEREIVDRVGRLTQPCKKMKRTLAHI